MFTGPFNRWSINRWLLPATRADFAQAVDGISSDMQKLTGDRYSLSVVFYKSADATQDEAGVKPRPAQAFREIVSLDKLDGATWRTADFVEATLSLRRQGDSANPPMFETVRIGARWPDRREISFDVQPAQHSDDLRHTFLENRFILWGKSIVIP